MCGLPRHLCVQKYLVLVVAFLAPKECKVVSVVPFEPKGIVVCAVNDGSPHSLTPGREIVPALIGVVDLVLE